MSALFDPRGVFALCLTWTHLSVRVVGRRDWGLKMGRERPRWTRVWTAACIDGTWTLCSVDRARLVLYRKIPASLGPREHSVTP